MGLRSDHFTETSYASVAPPEIGATGQRLGYNMISAITNKGHWPSWSFRGSSRRLCLWCFCSCCSNKSPARSLLLSKGIPLLWQAEELCENYFLSDFGSGRVSLLLAPRWDDFYDECGQGTLRLARPLLQIRHDGEQFRRGEYLFFNEWERYQSQGVLLFARWTASRYALVAVNTIDHD